jgi:AcrR family transcriptional regulator
MLTPTRKGSDYHHGDLRHSAVLAARNLVATGGLHSLGLRKVSTKVGVSPAALYRHFENLEQLRADVAAQIRSEIAELMIAKRNRVPKSPSAKKFAIERFEALGEGYVEYAKRNPRLFEIAFTPCEEESTMDLEDRAWQVLQESVLELENAGLLDRKTKALAPMLAWSSVHGLATLIAQAAIPAREHQKSLKEIFAGIQLALFKS